MIPIPMWDGNKKPSEDGNKKPSRNVYRARSNSKQFSGPWRDRALEGQTGRTLKK
jgi:hypothetical protein